jgi:hypothetical protein
MKRIVLSVLTTTALAAVPACFAQSTGTAPGSALGSSGSTLGQPGSSLGVPATSVPSTGAILRPGDTTLPGTPTTPGLSTLPGAASATTPSVLPPLAPSTPGPSVLPSPSDPLDRNSSIGSSSRSPFGTGGTSPRPNCIPGSITNPC